MSATDNDKRATRPADLQPARTVTAPARNQGDPDSKTSGALLAFVRVLARRAAAEVERSGYIPADEEGSVP